jgi:hypothetical protein
MNIRLGRKLRFQFFDFAFIPVTLDFPLSLLPRELFEPR